MPKCNNQLWNELHAKMTAKRAQNGRTKHHEKAPTRELVVQRLTAEPDMQQTDISPGPAT